MLADRSTKTLLAVSTLVAAILLAIRAAITKAEWWPIWVLLLISLAFWVWVWQQKLTVVDKEDNKVPPEKVATTVERAKKAVAQAEAAVSTSKKPTATLIEETPPIAQAPVSPPKKVTETGDDLTRIEGIGPKFQDALIAAGIKTYAQLAKIGEADLLAAIKAAGMRRPASLPTWAEQAGYAARGDWDGLAKLQSEMRGGRR